MHSGEPQNLRVSHTIAALMIATLTLTTQDWMTAIAGTDKRRRGLGSKAGHPYVATALPALLEEPIL